MFEMMVVYVVQVVCECEEQRCCESDCWLVLVFKVLLVGVCIVDVDGNLQLFNDQMWIYFFIGKVFFMDCFNYYWWQGVYFDGLCIEFYDFVIVCVLWGEMMVLGLEFQFIYDDGCVCWICVVVVLLCDVDGGVSGVFVIVVDIDDFKCVIECQLVLLVELQYCVCNIMLIIYVIVWWICVLVGSVDEYVECLCVWLMLLVCMQSLLICGVNVGVCLCGMFEEEIVVQILVVVVYYLQGEDVLLLLKVVEVLLLVIYELVINVFWYGVLVYGDGWVDVCWYLQVQDGQLWLGLYWCECYVEVEGWEMLCQ